jgi:hypothetical protein
MGNDEYLEQAREGMARIETYARDAAQRLGIAVTSISWGEGRSLTAATTTYPMRVTSGRISQTMEFPLEALADYPGGHGNAIPEANVDKLLHRVKELLE